MSEMFRALKVVTYGKAIGIGVTGAQYCGVEGVLKRNHISHPYIVANEYVSAEIARFIGLTIPPSYSCFDDSGEPIFISLNFNSKKSSLPPIIPRSVMAGVPFVCAGTVVLDILIANSDRHNGNLAYDMKTRTLAIFDHTHALFGYIPKLGIDRLDGLKDDIGILGKVEKHGHSGNKHCFVDLLSSFADVEQWIQRVEQIPTYVLESLCSRVEKLGITRAESDSLFRFLTIRKTKLRSLISSNKTDFKSILQWGLL